jgi:CRISPR-associated protein Csx17
MNYLKALGVFRLVAEQADSSATLSWQGGVARLTSKLDRKDLVRFFVEQYQPTPIVAPWNGGSGFFDSGREPLEAVERSDCNRLRPYRDAIQRIRRFAPEKKPKDDEKDSLLIQCRAELPDEVVPWLDVCFALGSDRVSFFPLLGTGGNDGRLDFTNNFMQRVGEVVSFRKDVTVQPQSVPLLEAALFADKLVTLAKTAIGQFNPGGIGGANGMQGSFEADSRVNPWDFVLMIEGTLLFAGAAARRLGVRSSLRAVFPFSVESIAVGYGSATASEETSDGSRAEMWLPMWSEAATYSEVQHLFAEGRAQIDRRQARNSVEFAVAVNLLGVNRGISSFARYGFLKRNGLAFLATPLGRLTVELRPKARLLNDPPLADWLDRWRRACSDKEKTPARYQAALRRIDRAMFAFACRSDLGDDATYLSDVLAALGAAERTLSRGLRFAADKYLRPLQRLSYQWIVQADDGSPEFRLAAALAGISGQRPFVGPLRAFLEEVEVSSVVNWAPGSTSAVWSNRPLSSNLAAVFLRRQMEAYRAGLNHVALSSAHPARLDDVAAFLAGTIDEEKLAALLWALPMVDWSDVEFKLPDRTDDKVLPFEYCVLRLLVEPLCLNASGKLWTLDGESESLQPDSDVFNLLASGRADATQAAMDRAARRLHSAGRPIIGHRNRRRSRQRCPVGLLSASSSERLLAAMLFPLSHRDVEQLANLVLYPPESQE